MNRLYWSGISNDERTKAISEITSIIGDHGTILNSQFFSDISLTLLVETEGKSLKEILRKLNRIMQMDEIIDPGFTDKNCLIFINITFSKGTGNLRIEVPSVPG